MSLIIASLDYDNKKVHLGVDRRVMRMSGEQGEEEVTKLLEIRPDLYFAVGGDLDNGKRMGILLSESTHLPASELISLIENFDIKTSFQYEKVQGNCIFILAGIFDDGDPFLYCRFTKENKNYFMRAKKGDVMRAIAAPDDKTTALVCEAFKYALRLNGGDQKAAIEECIQYAASIDNRISPTFDYVSMQSRSVKEAFLSVRPDGGTLITETVAVGSVEGVNNAGITGINDRDEESIRFYAGATFRDKDIAPFRVQDNGKVYMLDAVISGEVYATEGTIGGFSIGATRISSPHITQGGFGTEIIINSGTLATNPGDYGRIDVIRVTEAGRKVVASLDNGGGTFEHIITDSLDVVGAASFNGGVYMTNDFYFKQPLNANIKKANGVPYQGKIGLIQVSPNVYALGLID